MTEHIAITILLFLDTAGSLEKLRAERLILRNKELVIMKASQLVDALNSTLPEDSSTAKYSFRVVEEFLPMTRIPSSKRHGIKVPGIRKLYSICVVNGGLKFRAISCLECLERGLICASCSDAAHTVTPERVKELLGQNNECSEDEDSDAGLEEGDAGELLEENEEVESSESEEEDSEDEDTIEEGVTVWAPFGDKKYPALIVSLSSVPTYLHRQLRSNKSDMFIAKWVGERDENGNPIDRYSCLHRAKLLLGEESTDLLLAKNCPLEYMEALNQSQCP